jgi:hypothetical protein
MKGCRNVLQQWVRKSNNNIAAQIQKKTLELHSIQKEDNSGLLDRASCEGGAEFSFATGSFTLAPKSKRELVAL